MTTNNRASHFSGGFPNEAELERLGQTILAEILQPAQKGDAPVTAPSPQTAAAAVRTGSVPVMPGDGFLANVSPAMPEFAVPAARSSLPAQFWDPTRACDPYMFFDLPDVAPAGATPVSRVPPARAPLPLAPDVSYYFLDQTPRTDGAPMYGSSYDVEVVRRDFPILQKPVNGKPLVWLDNGATTQKPQAVIDALSYFYENDNSNVHRAAHTLAARATDAYENARKVVQEFIGASSPEEIVFVRGTTEAINLAAQSLGSHTLTPGDDILVSTLEHHANIVPWQMIAARTGAKLIPIPIDESGQIVLEEYYRLLSRRTKILAISHVSNVLGTVVPLEKMIGAAHEVGAKVLVDGAQSIAHVPVNVTALDADLFAFSGHKIYGPTGVGVLYGKLPLLEELPPWQGGGNMIDNVSFEKTTYNKPPAKFEAGTAILAGAVGLGAALGYLRQVGFERAIAHEDMLVHEGMRLLKEIPGLRILGTAPEKVAVWSFSMEGISPDDIGRTLTSEGVAIRVGHHCAQPVLRRYGFTSIARASLGMYNTLDEVRKLVDVLYRKSSAK